MIREKKTMIDTEKEIGDLKNTVMMLTTELIKQDYDPLSISAVLVQHALGLYKTILEPDDYEKIITKIYESRNQIKPFVAEEQTLQ